MKRYLFFLASLILSGEAHAAVPEAFDTNTYIACGTHSLGAVLMAKDSILLKKPVDAILADNFKSVDPLDVKLARLAVAAMDSGFGDKPEGAKDLLHFLAGVCYESGMKPGPIDLKNPNPAQRS
jgi:hypothetical protein